MTTRRAERYIYAASAQSRQSGEHPSLPTRQGTRNTWPAAGSGITALVQKIGREFTTQKGKQNATHLRGVNDGEQNAINACFGGLRSSPSFDSPEEYDLYMQGYDAGYAAIE